MSDRSFDMQPEGFHGDKFLINLIDILIKTGITNFIETGADVGSTLKFFAEKYKNINCYSCEPHQEAYEHALSNNINNKNVTIYNVISQEFFSKLNKNMFGKKTLFWLDAHGTGFEWPLTYEINFIFDNFKSPIILIDDFKVPDKPQFNFDKYGYQICSFDYIKDEIKFKYFHLYYQNYNDRTSTFHPLVGWGLLLNNQTNLKEIPEFVKKEF